MKASIWELLIVLAIALLIFGPKSLPKLGEAFGKTIGNFKKGLEADDDDEDEEDKDKPQKPRAAAAEPEAGAEEDETS